MLDISQDFFTVRFVLTVRCGSARFSIEPHRTVCFFLVTKTAPNRTVGFSKLKIRTAPYDSNKRKPAPNRGQALGLLKSSTLLRCGYGAVRFLTVLTEPHHTAP